MLNQLGERNSYTNKIGRMTDRQRERDEGRERWRRQEFIETY